MVYLEIIFKCFVFLLLPTKLVLILCEILFLELIVSVLNAVHTH